MQVAHAGMLLRIPIWPQTTYLLTNASSD